MSHMTDQEGKIWVIENCKKMISSLMFGNLQKEPTVIHEYIIE